MTPLFSPLDRLDRDRFARDMQLPAARIKYVMHFTPRSGSSWITDLATRTHQLSEPGECFNPSFMPTMTRATNAATMNEYNAILMRRRNTRGVYGFQITDHQMQRVFGRRAAFAERFPADRWHSFFLIREDIVAQAVSLAKMVHTDISHAPQADAQQIAARERGFVYDGKDIRRWLLHLLEAEQGSESFFELAGIAPLRLSYERNVAAAPSEVLDLMCRHIGIPAIGGPPQTSSHRKVGTSQNADYAARFRAENAAFLDDIAQTRAGTLARLAQSPAPGGG